MSGRLHHLDGGKKFVLVVVVTAAAQQDVDGRIVQAEMHEAGETAGDPPLRTEAPKQTHCRPVDIPDLDRAVVDLVVLDGVAEPGELFLQLLIDRAGLRRIRPLGPGIGERLGGGLQFPTWALPFTASE